MSGVWTCFAFCLFLEHTHVNKGKQDSQEKEKEKEEKKKKNHFLTSVYPHSLSELGSCNRPWQKAVSDPGRKLKAPQVRGH